MCKFIRWRNLHARTWWYEAMLFRGSWKGKSCLACDSPHDFCILSQNLYVYKPLYRLYRKCRYSCKYTYKFGISHILICINCKNQVLIKHSYFYKCFFITFVSQILLFMQVFISFQYLVRAILIHLTLHVIFLPQTHIHVNNYVASVLM